MEDFQPPNATTFIIGSRNSWMLKLFFTNLGIICLCHTLPCHQVLQSWGVEGVSFESLSFSTKQTHNGSIPRLAEFNPYGLILTDMSTLYKSDMKCNIILSITKDFLKSVYERPCTLFHHPERQQTWGEEASPWLQKEQFRGIQPLLASEVCDGEDLIEHKSKESQWVSQ